MDKGIYTALSGSLAKSHEIDLIANNLANVSTPGFKKDTGTFYEYLSELRRPDTVESLERQIKNEVLIEGRPTGDKSFVEMDGVYTSFSQGTVRQTSRPLDIAINGEAFFEVQGPQGVRYTRQGNFNRAANGSLVTANGYPVLAQGDGPPEGRGIFLNDGPFRVDAQGNIHQEGAIVATLSIQEFEAPQWLEKVGNSYFQNKHPDNRREAVKKSEVMQGYLEGSNVNPIHEMTQLIQATRAYETHMQAMRTFQSIDSKSANEIAKNY